MKVIARPLGTGKTKELMEMASAANGTILTINKRALQVKAAAYGFDSLDIIDIEDLIYGNYDDTKPLFVHKLDDVMQEYFKVDFNLDLQGFSVRMGD
jgi:hypothetical protein